MPRTQGQRAVGTRFVRLVLISRGESTMVEAIDAAGFLGAGAAVATCVAERRVDGSRAHGVRGKGGQFDPVLLGWCSQEGEQPDNLDLFKGLVLWTADIDLGHLAHPAGARRQLSHLLLDPISKPLAPARPALPIFSGNCHWQSDLILGRSPEDWVVGGEGVKQSQHSQLDGEGWWVGRGGG